VGGDKLRIDLHSRLPDAAVTEFKADLALRGSLMRDAQGTIRTRSSSGGSAAADGLRTDAAAGAPGGPEALVSNCCKLHTSSTVCVVY
jgi:hypothetical protein